jgi:hypothetical protein
LGRHAEARVKRIDKIRFESLVDSATTKNTWIIHGLILNRSLNGVGSNSCQEKLSVKITLYFKGSIFSLYLSKRCDRRSVPIGLASPGVPRSHILSQRLPAI